MKPSPRVNREGFTRHRMIIASLESETHQAINRVSLSLSLSLTHTYTHALSLSHSHTQIHAYTHARAHTHKHTHLDGSSSGGC